MLNKVVIVSGPTVEPIDPVRFISNRSSGKSGFYLAQEAVRRGFKEISFITGPTHYYPDNTRLLKVETALQMRAAVLKEFASSQVTIMVAAVSDYRVKEYSEEKIKKNSEVMNILLIKNPDILYELGSLKSENQVLVGYAAETENIIENGRSKLIRKNLDLLILNEISGNNPAFDKNYNQVYFISASGADKITRLDKSEIAVMIWDRIIKIYNNKNKQ